MNIPDSRILIAALLALTLGACGGGGSSDAGDSQAPVVAQLTTTLVSPGNFQISATSTDNLAVTAHCFKTSATAPLASDACFQASNQKALALALPMVPWYVWARDAAGNVSASPMQGPCSAAGYSASNASARPTVCMMTSLGEMVFALENVKAPVTSTNFLRYANDGFFSGTVFHRVISTFMVQGGGFTNTNGNLINKAPTYGPIVLEPSAATTLSNTAGTLAMARTNVLDSATSQFFVNVVDNLFLNTSGGGYAVFGQLIAGAATLDSLKSVAVVLSNGELSLPTSPPVIQWVIQLK